MSQQVAYKPGPETVEYSANNTVEVKLDRGPIYREISLRLHGQFTLSDTNNTSAKTSANGEFDLIERLELIINDSNQLRILSGAELLMLQRMMFGVFPNVSSTLGDGSTANPSFDVTFKIPLWLPYLRRPFDTVLDSSKVSSLKLRVKWKDHTDVNADATGFETDPEIDVSTLVSFGVDGKFSTAVMNRLSRDAQGANNAFKVDLEIGPSYRGFLIHTKDSSGDPDGSIVDNVIIKSGSVREFHNIDWPILREQYRLLRNMREEAWPINSDDGDITSWAFLDLVTDGLLTETIDTNGFGQFEALFDVTAQGTIDIVPVQIFKPANGNGS